MEVKYNGLVYIASINQRGISLSLSGKTRIEAITRVLHEYICELWK